MGPLVELIRQDKELQFDFEKQLELVSFQNELLSIINEFITQDVIRPEDEDIIGEAVGIWISCLTSEPKLLN